MLSPLDHELLQRAIELAENGRGGTSPNPLVGAVIVNGDGVVSEGWHSYAGGPHAEVVAIASADPDLLAGSDIYVSLEPCCHTGRTGPCTQAIIAAGIKRVVVAAVDPSSKVGGQGIAQLRSAGVEVAVADQEWPLVKEAKLQNQAFRKHIMTGMPWVVYKTAASIDGKTATHSGDSQWISGEESRALVHRWRSQFDAIMVGIGTAVADDPLLTARIPGESPRQPLRVVVDPKARLPTSNCLVQTADQYLTVVFVSREADADQVQRLGQSSLQVVQVEPDDFLSQMLLELGRRDVTSLLLEGGASLAGWMFDCGQIDQLRQFIAPLVVGGKDAPMTLAGKGHSAISAATRIESVETSLVGSDILLTATLQMW